MKLDKVSYLPTSLNSYAEKAKNKNSEDTQYPSIEVSFGELNGFVDIPVDDAFGKWVQGRIDLNLNLAKMAADLSDTLDRVNNDIIAVTRGRRWDFSISSENQLTIFSDDLSDTEKQQLGDILNNAGADSQLMQLRDIAVRGSQNLKDAATVYASAKLPVTNNFELDNSSFSQVFRARDFLNGAKENPLEFVSEINNKKYLWNSAATLINLMGNYPFEFDQSECGHIVDTHI